MFKVNNTISRIELNIQFNYRCSVLENSTVNRIYKIEGELYNISDTDLIDVDIHEGNEFFYFRRKIKVVDNNNEEYIAYTYFNSLGDGITLDNGNYKNYIKPY